MMTCNDGTVADHHQINFGGGKGGEQRELLKNEGGETQKGGERVLATEREGVAKKDEIILKKVGEIVGSYVEIPYLCTRKSYPKRTTFSEAEKEKFSVLEKKTRRVDFESN